MDAILTSEQVRSAVSLADAIDAVRDGFIRLTRGEFELPTRTVLGEGRFLVMSVRHAPTESLIVKTLSLNFGARTPAILGTVTWAEVGSSRQVVADANAVTRLRTAAASGVATDLLARADASALAMIGAGAQAVDQVRAVDIVRPLTSLTIVDRSVERARALAASLQADFPGFDIAVSDDAVSAVAEADIVNCATTSQSPLFPLEALRPDVHVNAIGAFRPEMRELPDELLADAGTVYIDELESILEESGEIIHALEAGAITQSSLVEIGRALVDGSVERSGRTVFKTVGIAVQDWVIARLLVERAAV